MKISSLLIETKTDFKYYIRKSLCKITSAYFCQLPFSIERPERFSIALTIVLIKFILANYLRQNQ